MRFLDIQTSEDFAGLEKEWNSFLKHSASHVPFLRHEFMFNWWKTLGGCEWGEGDLHIVIAREGDGELVGIAPLFFTKNRDGDPALMLLGSIEIADYLDLIARPENLSAFIKELIDFLLSPQVPPWKVLDWYNLVESSPTRPILRLFCEERGLAYSEDLLQHCPYIPLPTDWETYLAGIDKKQRHEIRRKMRRLSEYDLSTRWYIVEDGIKLDDEINDFLDLMAKDPRKAKFLTESMWKQMRAVMHSAFREGWLQLCFLEVDGEKAAGYLNFDYKNQIWVYNSGLDPRFYELSPGWVLLGYLLQWSIENGRAAFDFMRGEEEYKYRFGAVDRRVVRLLARR